MHLTCQADELEYVPIGAPKARPHKSIKIMDYLVYSVLLLISIVQSAFIPTRSSNLFLGHHHLLLLPALPLIYYATKSIHSTFQYLIKSFKWNRFTASSLVKAASSPISRIHLGLFLISSVICVASGLPYQIVSIGCFLYLLSVRIFYSTVVWHFLC